MVAGYSDDFVANREEAIELLITDNIQVRFHLLLTEFGRTSLDFHQQCPDSLAPRYTKHAIHTNPSTVGRLEGNLAIRGDVSCWGTQAADDCLAEFLYCTNHRKESGGRPPFLLLLAPKAGNRNETGRFPGLFIHATVLSSHATLSRKMYSSPSCPPQACTDTTLLPRMVEHGAVRLSTDGKKLWVQTER